MTVQVQAPSPLAEVAPTALTTRRRTIGLVAALCFVAAAAACGWQIYTDLDNLVGARAFGYALAFAAIPVLPLVALCLWLNRSRPEPISLLLVALVWGTFIATLLSLRLNSWMAGHIGDQFGASPRSAIFVAPWVEEPAKAAVIFAIAWWRRARFNSVMAGVVYAVMAGVGFAFTENVVYYAQVFQLVHDGNGSNASALDAVQHLFVWRGLATPFIHPMFTALTGAGIGIAVRHRHLGVRILAPVAGFCGAALLHMSYNSAASFVANDALDAVYLAVLLPYFLVCLAVLAAVRRYDDKVVAARLMDYSTYGWLPADQIQYIVSPRGRSRARRHVRRLGKDERRRVRAFQRSGMELGVLRDRMVRGVAGKADLAREAELIASLRAMRGRVLLPGAAVVPAHYAPSRSSW